jgi:hypothetical protein
MRRGFGIITAIIIMMTVATLMSLMIGLSSSTVKQTSDIYLKQQAELLLRSSTEFALLAISGHNNSIDCVENINITYNSFTSNVNIWYLGSGIPAGCNHNLSYNVQTDDSNYTAIIDVTVSNNQST